MVDQRIVDTPRQTYQWEDVHFTLDSKDFVLEHRFHQDIFQLIMSGDVGNTKFFAMNLFSKELKIGFDMYFLGMKDWNGCQSRSTNDVTPQGGCCCM